MKFHTLISIILLFNFACSRQPQPVTVNGMPVAKQTATDLPIPLQPISNIAFQKDGINDVTDGNNKKPSKILNGIDLKETRLEIVDSVLTVTFESNTEIPRNLPTGESSVWEIKIWNKDKTQGYQLGAKVAGSEWFVFIFNLKTFNNIYVEKPSISGNKLTANFPLSNLPNLEPPFSWSAASEYDGKWSDRIPDNGEASFPN